MAKIIWRDEASRLLEQHIEYAMSEFGRKTVKKWYGEIKRIESRLSSHPESFTKEPILYDMNKEYRGAILMKNFKLVHYYEKMEDTVYIVTIWDMRMNPTKLKKSRKRLL